MSRWPRSDDDRKGEILPYIERSRDEPPMPIIYVTHAVPEIARLATSVVLMARWQGDCQRQCRR